jgi:hypothetical protein
MKRIFLTLIAASVVLISCNNNASTDKKEASAQSVPTVTGAGIAFEKKSFDFGKVKDGEKVTHEFKFTNNGTEPLIISNATATCGCTVPEYPKTPIAPGESGVIKVVFNSAGKMGLQNKVVSVTSNTTPTLTEVYLTGEVLAKK